MECSIRKRSGYGIVLLLVLASTALTAGCSQKPATAQSAGQAKQVTAPAAQTEQKRKNTAAVDSKSSAMQQKEAQPDTGNAPGRSQPSTTKSGCTTCGTVVSIRTVETEGQGSGLGVFAGGLLGGLLGNQVGHGSGRDVATIAGAVGGAIAGNKVEKTVKKTTSYDITVKMETGEQRSFHQAAAPALSIGQKVRVENNALAAY